MLWVKIELQGCCRQALSTSPLLLNLARPVSQCMVAKSQVMAIADVWILPHAADN